MTYQEAIESTSLTLEIKTHLDGWLLEDLWLLRPLWRRNLVWDRPIAQRLEQKPIRISQDNGSQHREIGLWGVLGAGMNGQQYLITLQ